MSDAVLRTVTVTVDTRAVAGRRLLAPIGMRTPHQTPVSFAVDGAAWSLAGEARSGQMAALIVPQAGDTVRLKYGVSGGGAAYPESLFDVRDNRFTRAADGLVAFAQETAAHAADGHAAITAIANEVATRFSYGHPATRFNDGHDDVPYLACGVTEGSCVDINTYLIASLRSAGFEAGYVTGYFFPAEKAGVCDDMHCWVVTRHRGVVCEWDIAHHLKLGTTDIRPGLNPKPGERIALAHSMGLDFPRLNVAGMKLLAEPVWIDADGTVTEADVAIHLTRDEPTASAGRAPTPSAVEHDRNLAEANHLGGG